MSEHMNEIPKSLKSARWTAGLVIGGGLLASVAGNVQSILLEDSTPSAGSLLSAVWWPALLFGMIHLALTIPWGDGKWRVIRWIGPGVIGGLAFYISFFHLAHVLSSFGYDVVSRYAGPLTVDVAMFVATIAWHRVGVAIALAKAPVANEVANEELAKPAEVATVASAEDVAMADLASDWDGLEEELASYVAAEKARPVSAPPAAEAAPEPTAEPAQEPAPAQSKSALTTVPTDAAKLITAALEADPKATAAAIARDLVAAGAVDSDRSGRRYVAAIKNGTARLA
jgi:hypothetical protein